jgi:hypothetical protein
MLIVKPTTNARRLLLVVENAFQVDRFPYLMRRQGVANS